MSWTTDKSGFLQRDHVIRDTGNEDHTQILQFIKDHPGTTDLEVIDAFVPAPFKTVSKLISEGFVFAMGTGVTKYGWVHILYSTERRNHHVVSDC